MGEALRLVNGRTGEVLDYPKEPRYAPKRGAILIRKRERDASPSGLVLPTNMERSLREGEVVMVGAERFFENGVKVPMDVKVGDVVLYQEQAALTLDPHDPSLAMIVEENMLAVRVVE